jgi:hypothetical protein
VTFAHAPSAPIPDRVVDLVRRTAGEVTRRIGGPGKG